MSDYLLITGMSGAGRSTAAAALEDSGWYVIDNMPPSLLAEVANVVGGPDSGQDRVALVIGSRWRSGRKHCPRSTIERRRSPGPSRLPGRTGPRSRS